MYFDINLPVLIVDPSSFIKKGEHYEYTFKQGTIYGISEKLITVDTSKKILKDKFIHLPQSKPSNWVTPYPSATLNSKGIYVPSEEKVLFPTILYYCEKKGTSFEVSTIQTLELLTKRGYVNTVALLKSADYSFERAEIENAVQYNNISTTKSLVSTAVANQEKMTEYLLYLRLAISFQVFQALAISHLNKYSSIPLNTMNIKSDMTKVTQLSQKCLISHIKRLGISKEDDFTEDELFKKLLKWFNSFFYEYVESTIFLGVVLTDEKVLYRERLKKIYEKATFIINLKPGDLFTDLSKGGDLKTFMITDYGERISSGGSEPYITYVELDYEGTPQKEYTSTNMAQPVIRMASLPSLSEVTNEQKETLKTKKIPIESVAVWAPVLNGTKEVAHFFKTSYPNSGFCSKQDCNYFIKANSTFLTDEELVVGVTPLKIKVSGPTLLDKKGGKID